MAEFLRQCEAAKRTLSGLRYLDDDRENKRLLSKLPDWLIPKWGASVADYRERNSGFPDFSVFVAFVVKQSDIANDSITSISSIRSKASDKSKGSSNASNSSSAKCGGRSLNTKSSPKSSGQASSDQQSNKSSESVGQSNSSRGQSTSRKSGRKPGLCLFCSYNHETINCRKLCSASEADREAFIKAKSVCLGCLKPGHLRKDCSNWAQCQVCQSKFHPTALHGWKLSFWKPKQSASDIPDSATASAIDSSEQSHLSASAFTFVPDTTGCAPATANSGAICLRSSAACHVSAMIVPVYVFHSGFPGKRLKVYALLDTQSDATFVLDAVCDQLNVTGPAIDLSLSTMHAENSTVKCRKVSGLSVRGLSDTQVVSLPPVYTRQSIPVDRSHFPCSVMSRNWPHLQRVVDQLSPVMDIEVGLLIGYNCPRALLPREVVPAPCSDGPYGQRTDLGWGIVGVIDQAESNCSYSHRVLTLKSHVDNASVNLVLSENTKEVLSPRAVLNSLENDFVVGVEGQGMSTDDRRFLEIMTSKIVQLSSGFYEMPLPFRGDIVPLQNNKPQALQRLQGLKSPLSRDSDYRLLYTAFMNDMIENQYCEEVPQSELDCDSAWFIPHHGVVNTAKKKLRVVFDCSARWKGISLNDCLLQGPDLTNTLFGVLCRFRKERVAFMCDIKKMFYRFKVRPCHRDYLRFFWYKDGDVSTAPVQYRMTVHIFGATSSPGCSNFGLKQVALDYQGQFGADVGVFIKQDFYVDDGLKSVDTPAAAVDLIDRTVKLCAKGNLKLHKFVSSSREVLRCLDKDARADALQNIDLVLDDLPVERALGLGWNIELDVFCFKVVMKERPSTRRGILSTVMSVYDPLGFLAPVSLLGKQLIQFLCVQGSGWDEPVPKHIDIQWLSWLADVKQLSDIQVRRCIRPRDFDIVSVEFHHFCDGSLLGFGCCSYLRLVSSSGLVHVSLVMAKSRVAPIKPATVPRLELSAAVLAVKASLVLDKEFGYTDAVHEFWCDSKVVLGYIANSSRRFHIFVANRVGFIQSHTHVRQWRYVPSAKNIADVASRGCSAKALVGSRWFVGPEFLWQCTVPDF